VTAKLITYVEEDRYGGRCDQYLRQTVDKVATMT